MRCLLNIRRPPISPLFPYTTLFRSLGIDFLDTADVYGPYTNEQPVGPRSPGPRAARDQVRDRAGLRSPGARSEEHTSELQSQFHLVCRLLLEKKKRSR